MEWASAHLRPRHSLPCALGPRSVAHGRGPGRAGAFSRRIARPAGGRFDLFGAQLTIGLGLWLAASLMFVAVHTALWTSRGGWRQPLRYAIAAVLMSVPPFGTVGWAHPITAAGILFPGWAWFGLAATAALLITMTTRLWPIAAGVAALAFAWSAFN